MSAIIENRLRVVRLAIAVIFCSMCYASDVQAQVPGQRPPSQQEVPVQQQRPGQVPPAIVGQPVTGPPPAPFQMTPEQEAYLDQVLTAYEQSTAKIRTFESTFIRWEYDQRDRELRRSTGKLSHKSPDKGTYRIDKTEVPVAGEPGKYQETQTEFREHWVTDGKVVLEYDYINSQVVERPIPEEAQGQAIQNSPIPFVFGAKPGGLKQRYWLRVVTPQQFAQQEIWLEAYPRFRADAGSFHKSIIRLNRTNFEPVALRLYLPTREYHSYKFENVSINPLLPDWRALFSPTVPRGWKLVRKTPPAGPPAAAASRPVPRQR